MAPGPESLFYWCEVGAAGKSVGLPPRSCGRYWRSPRPDPVGTMSSWGHSPDRLPGPGGETRRSRPVQSARCSPGHPVCVCHRRWPFDRPWAFLAEARCLTSWPFPSPLCAPKSCSSPAGFTPTRCTDSGFVLIKWDTLVSSFHVTVMLLIAGTDRALPLCQDGAWTLSLRIGVITVGGVCGGDL